MVFLIKCRAAFVDLEFKATKRIPAAKVAVVLVRLGWVRGHHSCNAILTRNLRKSHYFWLKRFATKLFSEKPKLSIDAEVTSAYGRFAKRGRVWTRSKVESARRTHGKYFD